MENSRLDRAGSKQETSSISFPRRTGQKDANGGENESGFFRQEDPPTKKQLRRDEAESERSGERLLQAARRVSAANQFAGLTGGLWELLGYDGLEGQRPRLTHFSTTAVRNRFQTQL